MAWLFGVLAATLGLIFLWGVFAPRSQWHALAAWSVSDEHAHEPGGAAYGWRRALSGFGALAIAAVLVISASSAFGAPAPVSSRVDRITTMWGDPHPAIVDRTITPVGVVPVGLVEMPITGYQAFDEEDGLPDYLASLQAFKYLGALEVPGFIGTIPDVGFSALDFADMVIHTRGPLLCIPRDAVVIESETDIKIGVYYGAPNPAEPDNAAVCGVDASVTASVLLPINLQSPVGDRVVTALDGTPLTSVPIVENE